MAFSDLAGNHFVLHLLGNLSQQDRLFEPSLRCEELRELLLSTPDGGWNRPLREHQREWWLGEFHHWATYGFSEDYSDSLWRCPLEFLDWVARASLESPNYLTAQEVQEESDSFDG